MPGVIPICAIGSLRHGAILSFPSMAQTLLECKDATEFQAGIVHIETRSSRTFESVYTMENHLIHYHHPSTLKRCEVETETESFLLPDGRRVTLHHILSVDWKATQTEEDVLSLLQTACETCTHRPIRKDHVDYIALVQKSLSPLSKKWKQTMQSMGMVMNYNVHFNEERGPHTRRCVLVPYKLLAETMPTPAG